MRILLTGGAGFIGSNFIHYILKNYNDEIINLDKLTYAGNLDNLKEVENNKNYTFIKGDICDRNLVEDIFKEKIDYLVNFAAETHVDRSIKSADIFLITNVLGTEVLLDIAKKYGLQKFVQISTDEVYGSVIKGDSFTEDSPVNPSSPYAASKASADLLAKSYYKTYGLNVNITRSSNNFGPYQYPEKLIPLFTTNALEDKKLPLYGDGNNIRDWLYVKDHCKAIDLVLRKGKAGGIYNIGASNERRNLVITEKILDILNKSKTLIKYVKDRPAHDRRYAIDFSKINNELGYKADRDFDLSLRDTINWYQEHQDWWKKIKKENINAGN